MGENPALQKSCRCSATRKCHFIMSRSRDIIFNRIRVITARNDKLILWNKIYRGNWATMDTGEPRILRFSGKRLMLLRLQSVCNFIGLGSINIFIHGDATEITFE